jgi:hypothetical protein
MYKLTYRRRFQSETRHDITEILLKVALNTIKQTNQSGTTFIGYPQHQIINKLINEVEIIYNGN